MNEYIRNGNNVFYKLKENISSFNDEAIILDEVKCYLINFKTLDDFDYPNAYIYEIINGYHIDYNDVSINIEVEDGVITDCSN